MKREILFLATAMSASLVVFNSCSKEASNPKSSDAGSSKAGTSTIPKNPLPPDTGQKPAAPPDSAPNRFELKDAGGIAWFSRDGGVSDDLAAHFEMSADERKVIGNAVIAFNKEIAEHIVQNAVREVSSTPGQKIWTVPPFLEDSKRSYAKVEKVVAMTLDSLRSTALRALFESNFIDRGWYKIVMTLNSGMTDDRAFRFENRHPETGNSSSSWPATREQAERRLGFSFDQLP